MDKSKLAIGSLISGILVIIFYLLSGSSAYLANLFLAVPFLSIVSLVLGIVALINIRVKSGKLEGKWMAWVGVIIGLIAILSMLFYLFIISQI